MDAILAILLLVGFIMVLLGSPSSNEPEYEVIPVRIERHQQRVGFLPSVIIVVVVFLALSQIGG